MPSIELDPREARPLTSREISKVLSGIVGGVVAVSPSQRDVVVEIVRAVIKREPAQQVGRIPTLKYGYATDIVPSWACAFSATVAGLRGWCDPQDVKTALDWITQNIEVICSGDADNLPAN